MFFLAVVQNAALGKVVGWRLKVHFCHFEGATKDLFPYVSPREH